MPFVCFSKILFQTINLDQTGYKVEALAFRVGDQ